MTLCPRRPGLAAAGGDRVRGHRCDIGLQTARNAHRLPVYSEDLSFRLIQLIPDTAPASDCWFIGLFAAALE